MKVELGQTQKNECIQDQEGEKKSFGNQEITKHSKKKESQEQL
jgi:hypothetical protein